MTEGERHLVEFMNDMSGSFFTHLFQAIFKADRANLERMRLSFPEEVQAVIRYQNEDGYWDKLQERYKNEV